MRQRAIMMRMVQRLLRRGRWLARPARVAAWRPLCLRWARKAPPAAHGLAPRARALPAAPVIHQVHWHLHGAVLAGAGNAHDGGRAAAIVTAPLQRVTDRLARGVGLAWRHGQPAVTSAASRTGPAFPRTAGSVLRQCIAPMPGAPTVALRDGVPLLLRAAGEVRPATPLPLARAAAAARVAPVPSAIRHTQAGPVRRGARAPLPAVPASPVLSGRVPIYRPPPGPATRTFSWTGRASPGQRMNAPAPAPTAMPAGGRSAAGGWRVIQAAAHAVSPVGAQAVLSVLPPVRRIDVPRTASTTAPGIDLARTLDLAWRAVPARTPGHAGAAGLPLAPGAPGGMSPSVATPVPVRSNPASTVPATALDPALASRLADEVIRRIDLRARIARERGL